MRNLRKITCIASAIALMSIVSTLPAQDTPAGNAANADALIAEIQAAKPAPPDRSKQDDPEYRKQYSEQVRQAMTRRAELARQFYDRFPDHPQAGKIMEGRWQSLVMTDKADVVMTETQMIITEKPTSPVATSARYARAMITLQQHSGYEPTLTLVEEFIAAAPSDPRGGDLLVQLANYGTDDATKQLNLLKRVQTQFPDSPAAKRAMGSLRQVDAVGNPFELAFTDAISGKPVSSSSLKGKVVVVDFWATWCGPCVAEMPHMKQLYSQWKDKGVEFVGISLDAPEDQGGLEALKKFVAENHIAWPQYYQGKGWQSEFSSGWGINSIPALFVVDANGNLASNSARGKLEQIVPELIAKRDGKSAGAR